MTELVLAGNYSQLLVNTVNAVNTESVQLY